MRRFMFTRSTGSVGVGEEVLNLRNEATTLSAYPKRALRMFLPFQPENRRPINKKVELDTIIFGSSAVIALFYRNHSPGWHFTWTIAAMRSLSDRALGTGFGWTVSWVH